MDLEDRMKLLESRVNKVEEILDGNGALGLVAWVEILKRTYVGALVATSSIVSSVVTYIVTALVGGAN